MFNQPFCKTVLTMRSVKQSGIFPWNSLRYSGHNRLRHLGKFRGRNLALGKEGKTISMPQKLSFKLQICSGAFRVRISSKEENILKPQLSNKGEDQGDGLKKEKKILEEIVIDVEWSNNLTESQERKMLYLNVRLGMSVLSS